jgi:hypothetical protein
VALCAYTLIRLSLILASGIARFEFYEYFGIVIPSTPSVRSSLAKIRRHPEGVLRFEHPFSLSAVEGTFSVREAA